MDCDRLGPCPRCKGKGHVEERGNTQYEYYAGYCDDCAGSGRVEVRKHEPSKHSKTDTIPCATCQRND